MTRQYKIVDSDQHVNPPGEFWREYLPARFKDRAPVIEERDDGRYFIFEGREKKLSTLGAMGGKKAEDFTNEAKKTDLNSASELAGRDGAARIEAMDEDGIDAAVMFGGGPLATTDPDLFLESFNAYNRWLSDFCATDRDRLFGVAYVPMLAEAVDVSIELLKQAHAGGFRGVNIPAFPMTKRALEALGTGGHGGPMLALTGDQTGEVLYSDPVFDPFWATAADLGMPITIHLGSRSPRLDPRHFLSDLLMSKLTMAEPVAIMTYGGAFERHPELKFVTVEAGVGWFAFAADYMDKTWEKQRFWTKNTLKEKPSFYLDRNLYGTFIHDQPGIDFRNHPVGRNIMWSSDYPHSETTYPKSHAMIEKLFADASAADRQAILCDRARAVFNI